MYWETLAATEDPLPCPKPDDEHRSEPRHCHAETIAALQDIKHVVRSTENHGGQPDQDR